MYPFTHTEYITADPRKTEQYWKRCLFLLLPNSSSLGLKLSSVLDRLGRLIYLLARNSVDPLSQKTSEYGIFTFHCFLKAAYLAGFSYWYIFMQLITSKLCKSDKIVKKASVYAHINTQVYTQK